MKTNDDLPHWMTKLTESEKESLEAKDKRSDMGKVAPTTKEKE